MKKILVLLCFTVLTVFAQSQKPEFLAFSGELLKFGKVNNGYQNFMLEAKGVGYAFKAIGQVLAPADDPFVLPDGATDGTVVAIVAYIPALAAGTNGKDYQVGMFDMKIYFEDELQTTRNVKFKLLPPADDEWAMNMARDAASIGAASMTTLWNGSNDMEITKVSAVPIDRITLNPPPKPKRVEAPKPAPIIQKPVEKEETPVVKKKRVVKKQVVQEEDEKPVVKKKRIIRKKRIIQKVEEDEEEGLTIKEKRRRAAAKKRQKAAQFEDYSD